MTPSSPAPRSSLKVTAAEDETLATGVVCLPPRHECDQRHLELPFTSMNELRNTTLESGTRARPKLGNRPRKFTIRKFSRRTDDFSSVLDHTAGHEGMGDRVMPAEKDDRGRRTVAIVHCSERFFVTAGWRH